MLHQSAADNTLKRLEQVKVQGQKALLSLTSVNLLFKAMVVQ